MEIDFDSSKANVITINCKDNVAPVLRINGLPNNSMLLFVIEDSKNKPGYVDEGHPKYIMEKYVRTSALSEELHNQVNNEIRDILNIKSSS